MNISTGTELKYFISAFVLTALFSCSVSAAGIVKGRTSAAYEFHANRTAPFIVDYANDGYEQKVTYEDSGVISVELNILSSPMHSSVHFPLKDNVIPDSIISISDSLNLPPEPELNELSLNLTSHCRTEFEAVTNILLWISENIEYTAVSGRRDDALSVYESFKGNCVGRVNIAIALLGQVGIPARRVHGLCIDNVNNSFTKLGRGNFHRWLEVYYPDRGWVFSDPGRSVNTVDSRYIVIDSKVTNPYHIASHNIRKISSKDNLVVVDCFPEGIMSIIMRPNDCSRYSDTVVGLFKGFPGHLLTEGQVSIFQNGKKTGSMKKLKGKKHFSFTDLAANMRYFMRIRIPGMQEETYTFSTAGNRLKVINIELLKDAG